jgi:hypothetical protein
MENDVFDYYREREEHTVALADAAIEEQQELDEEEEEEDPVHLRWRNLSEDDERCRVFHRLCVCRVPRTAPALRARDARHDWTRAAQ